MATAKNNQKKVTSRQLVSGGRLLITFEDGMKAILNTEDIQMIQLLGVSVPKPGDSVMTEPSVNTTTGAVSGDWVRLTV